MAYPFFSLSKSHRIRPIDFTAGNVSIRVEAVPDHGMATIWDADILIWAASQIVEARDAGLRTSRLMAATPYEILTFTGRGTSQRAYQRLKAALDRLQSTTVATSIRQPANGRRHRFSWINEWHERTDSNGRSDGIEMIVPDWFYSAVLDDALILTIDRAYFDLTGGLDRWLYRLVRKHGGRQKNGWRFDFRHLHQKSGSLSPFKRFAFELRDIGLTGVERPVEAIFRIGDAEAGLSEAHFPQVRVRPREGGLEDGVQTVEPDIERHLQGSADGWRDIVQRNLHPHHGGVAHAAFSRSLVSLDACHLHGRKSSIRLIGWLPMRSMTSVNHASGSTPLRRHVPASE